MLTTLKKVTEEALEEIEEEKSVRKTDEVFILYSLGSQFDHLIKQEAEKRGVFCLVADPENTHAEDVRKVNPKGIILSGGPVSVYSEAPSFDGKIFDLGIPVMGICLGFQLWAKHMGIGVKAAMKKEFGVHNLVTYNHSLLFKGCDIEMPVLQSHGDIIENDDRLEVLAATDNSPVAAARLNHLWGVQFHPEVPETIFGPKIFENFFFEICGAKDRYPAENVAHNKINLLSRTIGDKNVLIALSGGSDSSTCAHLIKEAKKEKSGRVHAVYIKGIDRPDDELFARKYFENEDWLTLHVVDATDRFLEALCGKLAMKEKRIAIRGVYKAILEEMAEKVMAEFIVQGTLYTDISESGYGYSSGAKKARIKLHHNVKLDFKLEEITPLDDCVKDGGRNIGRSIGVPEELLTRHPFPGVGLPARIDGEITAEKLKISHEADRIYIEELRKWNLYNQIWQAGAIVTNTLHTCTKGDDAMLGYVLMYFAVVSVNGFTAQPFDLPFDFRVNLSRRLGNEIKEVGATAYRDSGKPYSTIELG
jgi:GMP synthase (glutamine-hydrolysing)